MDSTRTTTIADTFLRWGTLLALLPAMIIAGCDSNDSGMEDPPPDDGETFSVAHYDTTDTEVDGKQVIRVSDNSGGENSEDQELGIGYVDADGNEVSEITWSNDFVYQLDGFVFVNDGEELTIDPGTLVQGLPGDGENASALIIARGGQIVADGNPGSDDPSQADPIIFTAEADDGSGLGRDIRGEWGGVIMLGDATINSEPTTTAIEGVPEDIGGDRNDYGAENGDFNDSHDIGTFRFVSIRHTGTTLQGGSEIQGLTLGGVGNGSTIEYVESYASDDDGFEWFGGTVNTKYLIAAFVSDDSYDIDEGWRGSNQFWLAVQATDEAGRIGEHDGGTEPETGEPFATTKVANATYIGVGPDADVSGDQGEPMIIQRDNNATSYYNSIFMDGRTTGSGLEIEQVEGGDASDRWREDTEEGRVLRHENNIWYNVGPDYDAEAGFAENVIQLTGDTGTPEFEQDLETYLENEGNILASESPVEDIARNGDAIDFVDPRPTGPALNTELSPAEAFGEDYFEGSSYDAGVNGDLEDVDYKGAFSPNGGLWLDGWTLLSQEGEVQ